MSETIKAEKGLNVNVPLNTAEGSKSLKQQQTRLANNYKETKEFTDQFKDVKSSIPLAGVDTRVEKEERDGEVTFYFTDREPTYYLNEKVTIPVKNHIYRTSDELVKNLLRTNGRFGLDVFEGTMPKHVIEAIKRRKTENQQIGAETYYENEDL
jgi:hypothetical protein